MKTAQNIIRQLTTLLEGESITAASLEPYQAAYLESLENYSKICAQCEEWMAMELPYDCLSKPDYCVKNPDDAMIIKLYEELREIAE